MKNTLTPELLAKAKQVETPEELAALAKENGVELTAESAKAYFDQLHKDGELADDELDSVAGGGSQCSTPVPFNQPLTPEDIEEMMKKSQEMMQPQTTES